MPQARDVRNWFQHEWQCAERRKKRDQMVPTSVSQKVKTTRSPRHIGSNYRVPAYCPVARRGSGVDLLGEVRCILGEGPAEIDVVLQVLRVRETVPELVSLVRPADRPRAADVPVQGTRGE